MNMCRRKSERDWNQKKVIRERERERELLESERSLENGRFVRGEREATPFLMRETRRICRAMTHSVKLWLCLKLDFWNYCEGKFVNSFLKSPNMGELENWVKWGFKKKSPKPFSLFLKLQNMGLSSHKCPLPLLSKIQLPNISL